MARIKPFSRLDGVPQALSAALLQAMNALADAVNANDPDQPVSQLAAGSYSARYNDVARVSAGGSLSLPPANASSAAKRVELIVTGSGSVRVTAQAATLPGGVRQGTVNGASSDSVTGPGFAEFCSDGAGGWHSTSSSYSGALLAFLEELASAAVANNSITNTMLADMPQATVKGRPLTGGAGDPQNLTRAQLTTLVQPGNAIDTAGGTAALIGSVSTINVTPTSGALGDVNLATLLCGGVLTFQSLTADATIGGFTAKSEGFFFFLHLRDATTAFTIKLLEDAGATAANGIRTPDIRDLRLYKNDSAILVYSNARWRIMASMPRLFLTGVDTFTMAAQENNHVRSSSGQNRLRITLTGNQRLTGLVPDQSANGSPNGEIVVFENVDTVDTLTVGHEDAASTAANRFTLPNGADLAVPPRSAIMAAYDDTSARWRYLGLPPSTGGGGVTPSGTGFTHITAGVQDAAAKLVDTADINPSQVTNAKLANMAANTVKVEGTGAIAAPLDFALATNEVLGRSGGNITGITSAVQTALIRAAANIGWVAAAANGVLRRSGAGDLGFGTLVDGNLTTNTLTAASQAQMAQRTIKGNLTLATANEADNSTQTCRENIAGGLVTQTTAQLQTATTTNVTPGAYTVLANSAEAGSEYLCSMRLFCGRGATVTATNLIIELLVNGAVVRTVTLAIQIGASTNGAADIEGCVTFRTVGAGGTILTTLQVIQTITATSPPSLTYDPAPTGAAVATSALDTTANRTIEMRARLSVNTATVYVQLLRGTIAKIR